MNYAPYLGAIRGEHVRAAARSIGAALIEPGLEALLSVRDKKLRDGIRGPDFRFGAHETRAEQPPDDHPCPREIECSWEFARGFRAAPCRDVPAETERRRTWGSNGCGHLSWDPIGSMSSPHSRELIHST